MTITPEQNEQWQKAIPLLDYGDFYALSAEGIEQSTKRILAGRGAPGWAVTARSITISNGWKGKATWVPSFALRSEVAMIGLNLLYPKPEAHMALYRRLLQDFTSQALAPLAGVCPLLQELHALTRDPFPEEARLSGLDQALEERRLALAGQPYDQDQHFHLQRIWDSLKLLRLMLLEPPRQWWSRGGLHLGYYLSSFYEFYIKEDRASGSLSEEIESQDPHQPVADAFLAALESECPPPDWQASIKLLAHC